MDAPIGSPPTLEWIAAERLAIDESYQRATDSPASRRLINRSAAILDETGWKLTRDHTISVTGRINCAPMIARAVRKIGECPVRNALTALREAYPDQPVPNAATLLKPLFTIYRDKRISDPDLLIELLGAVSPLDWQLESAGLRLRSPQLSREEALVECLVRACEDAAADGKLAA